MAIVGMVSFGVNVVTYDYVAEIASIAEGQLELVDMVAVV